MSKWCQQTFNCARGVMVVNWTKLCPFPHCLPCGLTISHCKLSQLVLYWLFYFIAFIHNWGFHSDIIFLSPGVMSLSANLKNRRKKKQAITSYVSNVRSAPNLCQPFNIWPQSMSAMSSMTVIYVNSLIFDHGHLPITYVSQVIFAHNLNQLYDIYS